MGRQENSGRLEARVKRLHRVFDCVAQLDRARLSLRPRTGVRVPLQSRDLHNRFTRILNPSTDLRPSLLLIILRRFGVLRILPASFRRTLGNSRAFLRRQIAIPSFRAFPTRRRAIRSRNRPILLITDYRLIVLVRHLPHRHICPLIHIERSRVCHYTFSLRSRRRLPTSVASGSVSSNIPTRSSIVIGASANPAAIAGVVGFPFAFFVSVPCGRMKL